MVFSALVAQRIEQLPSKQWVVGSIPARGTIFLPVFHTFAIFPSILYSPQAAVSERRIPLKPPVPKFTQNAPF